MKTIKRLKYHFWVWLANQFYCLSLFCEHLMSQCDERAGQLYEDDFFTDENQSSYGIP